MSSGLIRDFSPGVVIDTAFTITGTVQFWDGAVNYPDPSPATWTTSTIAVGKYDFIKFLAYTNKLIRTAIQGVTLTGLTKPSVAATLFKTVAPAAWSSVPNGNVINCTFAPTGFIKTIGSVQTTIKVFTIATGATSWCAKLGLSREAASPTGTPTGASPNTTLMSFFGAFQPRGIYCFENSTLDSWDWEVEPDEELTTLADGTLHNSSMGSTEGYRELTLKDLPATSVGYPLDAAIAGGTTPATVFGADRGIINIQVPDIDGMTNVSGLSDNGVIGVGDLVRIGNDKFFARVAAFNSTTITLQEFYPATLAPSPGDTIYKISEAHALYIEAKRTGCFIIYEPKETGVGLTFFQPSVYAINQTGRGELKFPRLDPFLNYYSVTIPLARAYTSQLINP